MKRIVLLLLCAAMTLSLCACAGKSVEGERVLQPSETVTASPAPSLVPEPTAQPTPEIDLQAENDALIAVLTQIDEEARPGSAGSSLTAVRLAADMLNWAVATKLDAEQISTQALQWLEDMGYGAQSEFNRKLDDVYYAYQSLIAPDSAELMASAGVSYPEGNWGFEPLPAVEALESAVGTSDMIF